MIAVFITSVEYVVYDVDDELILNYFFVFVVSYCSLKSFSTEADAISAIRPNYMLQATYATLLNYACSIKRLYMILNNFLVIYSTTNTALIDTSPFISMLLKIMRYYYIGICFLLKCTAQS